MVASDPPRASEHDVDELLSLLDHLPGMVAYWDQELHNRIANAAYLEWFGRAPEEVRGMHIRDLLGPEVYEKNLPYIRGVLAGEPQLFNRTLIDALGRTRYTQASYIPHVVDGAVRGFFVLVTDISERVAAEAALQKSVADVALLEERQRVSGDLHDFVIQRLYAANLELSKLSRSLDPAEAKKADAVIDRIDEAIRELRAAIGGMSRTFEPPEFLAELTRIVKDSAAVLGFLPTLTAEGPSELVPAAARLDVLAVVQEALSNIARHAHATHASVLLTVIGPQVRVVVTDDGRGIGRTTRRSGLANMRARAERLGGQCTCSDNDPHGTIIDWRVPSTLAERVD